MSLIRDLLPTLNNGQFLELLPLFSDERKRLFFHMTTEQAVSYREAILDENGSLLMRIFLGELAATQNGEPSLKHRKTGDASESGLRRHMEWENEDEREDLTASPSSNQLVPALVFHPVSCVPSKQYGLSTMELTKALKNQLQRFSDHVTKPINLERAGSKISVGTADEQKASFLRYGLQVFYFVFICLFSLQVCRLFSEH